jgi:monothiol glutaredoxin
MVTIYRTTKAFSITIGQDGIQLGHHERASIRQDQGSDREQRSPQAPQCGFSAQTVQCLMACGERFAYVDILSNPDIRATLPQYANWPTFPQLFVDGDLVGGCDIVTEMYQSGELEPLIKEAAGNAAGPEA